jgi:hypothetical protein
MIGDQITVEYSDQNEDFKHLLPRSGRVVREVSLEDWGAGWSLLELDDALDYQQKVAEPYVFKNLHITHLLIKSRWEGTVVGDNRPVSVFVLLVPDVSTLGSGIASSNDFIHVCWGMAHTTTSNNSLHRSAG